MSFFRKNTTSTPETTLTRLNTQQLTSLLDTASKCERTSLVRSILEMRVVSNKDINRMTRESINDGRVNVVREMLEFVPIVDEVFIDEYARRRDAKDLDMMRAILEKFTGITRELAYTLRENGYDVVVNEVVEGRDLPGRYEKVPEASLMAEMEANRDRADVTKFIMDEFERRIRVENAANAAETSAQ